MHCWGDEDFTYWKELDEAASYIAKFCLKWGRIRVTSCKEKWGTVRVYCCFGWNHLADPFFPRTMFFGDWPKCTRWLWNNYLPMWVNKFVVPYHTFIYRLSYKNAIKKWPMIREEILDGADWHECLEGL